MGLEIMGRADYWLPGGWNMICQVCGFKYKNTEMKLRWDNVWCCPEDWEIRQPQDFVRGIADPMTVPYTVPEPPNTFIGFNENPLGEIVVGTPTVYLNGTVTAAYTIQLPQGIVTFTSPPMQGVIIAWTGTWLHNSGLTRVFTSPFQFGLGDGTTTVFNIYWAFGTSDGN